jgi:hypothetical protein
MNIKRLQASSRLILLCLISAGSVCSMGGIPVNAADMPVPPDRNSDTQEYYEEPLSDMSIPGHLPTTRHPQSLIMSPRPRS